MEHSSDDLLPAEIEHLFSHNLRYPTYIQQDSFLNQELAKLFSAFSFDSARLSHPGTPSLSNLVRHKRFFSSQKSHLVVSQSLSPFFDLYLFGAVSAWLALLFFLFRNTNDVQ